MFIIADGLNETVSIGGLSYDQLFLIQHALINLAANNESDNIKKQCEEIIVCIDRTTESLIGKSESY
jgi:hypothetical protein